MPSGLLCPYRYCQEYTVRHPLPLFGRCGLVHPRDARNRTDGLGTLQYKNGGGQLHRGRSHHPESSSLAQGAFRRHAPPLRSVDHFGHACMVRHPLPSLTYSIRYRLLSYNLPSVDDIQAFLRRLTSQTATTEVVILDVSI